MGLGLRGLGGVVEEHYGVLRVVWLSACISRSRGGPKPPFLTHDNDIINILINIYNYLLVVNTALAGRQSFIMHVAKFQSNQIS